MKTLTFAAFTSVVALSISGCQMPLFTNTFGSTADSKDRRVTASNPRSNPPRRSDRSNPSDSRRDIVDQRLVAGFIEKGRQAMASNQLADAAINFESVLRIDRNNATAFQLLGQIGDLTGNFKDAEHYYLQALTQRPNDPDLLSDIGYSYMQQGRFREAKSKLFESLKLNPGHRMAKINIAAVLAYEGDQQKAMAYLRQIGSEQEARQIMANLMRNVPTDRGSQTQLASNTQDENLSPAALDLRAQLDDARRTSIEKKRRAAEREDFLMRQRMTQAFGPNQNGQVEDRDINSMMSDVNRQHQQDINQIQQDNRSGVTRIDDRNRRNGSPNNQSQFQNRSQSDGSQPFAELRMSDGRRAVIDPRTGLVTPIGPPPSNNMNPNMNIPNRRLNDPGQPNVLQFPNTQFPNTNGQVVPNQSRQLQLPLDQNQFNDQGQFNTRQNQTQQVPTGNSGPLSLNSTGNQFNPNQPNRSNSGVMSNAGVQQPGAWQAGRTINPGDEAAQMRALQLGLAAGPAGMMPPDLAKMPAQEQNVRRIPTQGGPQFNQQSFNQQPQNQNQFDSRQLKNGQQFPNTQQLPNNWQPNPNGQAPSSQAPPAQFNRQQSQLPTGTGAFAGQRNDASAAAPWQPGADNGRLAAVPDDDISPMEHSSSQGQMHSENWRPMTNATRTEVPSSGWNYETNLPHQTAGPRSSTSPLGSEWRNGPLASPTLDSNFAQPRITHRDSSLNEGQEPISQFNLNRAPNSNGRGSSGQAFFQERF
jgi:Flp pilus assembly protein TadD